MQSRMHIKLQLMRCHSSSCRGQKAKFLNCPEPAEIVTVTVTEESGNNDNTLSLGLGVGLGVTTALFALVAIIYVGRTKKLQKTVDDMEKNKVAVSA